MMHPDLYGVRTLIFDMDGTLIASERTALASLRGGLEGFYQTLGKPAPQYTDEELIAGIGAPSDEFYISLLHKEDRDHLDDFRDFIHNGESDFLQKNSITFDGTHEVLETLRKRGYRLAVVSNCHTPYLKSVMETQNLARHFDIMSCVGDFPGATKEKLVRSAVEQLDGPAAVIGDRYYDIDAALANDLPSVGALYGYGNREELAKSSTWVADIRDLLNLFNPLREAASRVADTVNQARSIERPITVLLAASHPALSLEFSGLLITELTSLNSPVLQIDLFNTTGDDGMDWLKRDILDTAKSGRVETVYPGDGIRPLRARPGFVLLVSGKADALLTQSEQADLTVLVLGSNEDVQRAVERELNRVAAYIESSEELDSEAAMREAKRRLEEEFDGWNSVTEINGDIDHSAVDFVLDGSRLDEGRFLRIK